MKKSLNIAVKESFLKVMNGVTFAQVPAYFGEELRDLKMDLILPLDKEGILPKRPLIIWIIGGAWKDVDRSKFNIELASFAKAGFAVASIEYRVSHEAVFPAQIIDVKSAIRFLRKNAERFNLDTDHFYVMGESAGAHLAALAAASGFMTEWDKGDNTEVSSCVQGCVSLYGICDFLDHPLNSVPELFFETKPEELLVGGPITGDRRLLARFMNPLEYACDRTPPFLILHGTEDTVVPCRQSEILYEGLTKRGVKADLYLVEGANHADDRFYQEETKQLIISFLKGL